MKRSVSLFLLTSLLLSGCGKLTTPGDEFRQENHEYKPERLIPLRSNPIEMYGEYSGIIYIMDVKTGGMYPVLDDSGDFVVLDGREEDCRG